MNTGTTVMDRPMVTPSSARRNTSMPAVGAKALATENTT